MKGEGVVIGSLMITLLLLVFGFWIASPVIMTTADLGRHIANGRAIAGGGWEVLNSNYYSYTHTDFSVINHHWGSGLLLYWVDSLMGLEGVHWSFMIISLVTFLVWLLAAWRASSMPVVFLTAVLLMPLIVDRSEVRPEVMSYLFAGLFYLFLREYRVGTISWRWLFLLPVLQVIWANTHIYFVFGIYFVGLFWFENLLRWVSSRWRGLVEDEGLRLKDLSCVLGGVIMASLVTPFHIKGLIYPFTIFRNYGYQIVENKSVPWLEDWGMTNPSFLLLKIVIVVLGVLVLVSLIANRKRVFVADVLLAVTVLALSWLAIRNFTFTGLVLLPIASHLLYVIWRRFGADGSSLEIKLGWVVIASVVVLAVYFMQYENIQLGRQNRGVGLADRVDGAASFISDNELSGPIFNNYDIGGYLIYYLPANEKVFVDNRPEAYPKEFFEEVYIPMQLDDVVWQEQLEKYNFNMIVFSPQDLTNWGQEFINSRINDSEWASVFFDGYSLVLLRYTEENISVIEKHKISFGAS